MTIFLTAAAILCTTWLKIYDIRLYIVLVCAVPGQLGLMSPENLCMIEHMAAWGQDHPMKGRCGGSGKGSIVSLGTTCKRKMMDGM